MVVVSKILEKESEEAGNFPSISVEKHLELDVDVGNLLATDNNQFDAKLLK